jgi:hypothetical protein
MCTVCYCATAVQAYEELIKLHSLSTIVSFPAKKFDCMRGVRVSALDVIIS